MHFFEYQREAMKTALPTALNEPYMALGLASEAGEVAGKLKKAIRDQWTVDELNERIGPEIADVLWYAAGLCHVLHLDLDDLARANLAKLADRANRGKIGGSGDVR